MIFKTERIFDSKDIYTPSEDQAREVMLDLGYKIVDFRLPLKGEWYTAASGGRSILEAQYDNPMEEPRFIVEKIPKRKRTTLTETGEVRPPLKGEWYKYDTGYFRAVINHKMGDYPIYTVVETEV